MTNDSTTTKPQGAPRLDRRQLLAGAATAAIATAATDPAVATGPHPDAELLELGRAFDAAVAESDRSSTIHSQVEDRYRARVKAAGLDSDSITPPIPADVGHYYDTMPMVILRDMATLPDNPEPYWHRRLVEIRNQVGAHRVQEKHRIAAEVGLMEAEAAFKADMVAIDDLAERIVAMPAQTLDGVRVKAQLRGACYMDSDDILASIAEDLRRMAT